MSRVIVITGASSGIGAELARQLASAGDRVVLAARTRSALDDVARACGGEDRALVSPVDDAMRTMALVEACYASSAGGGTPIPPAA